MSSFLFDQVSKLLLDFVKKLAKRYDSESLPKTVLGIMMPPEPMTLLTPQEHMRVLTPGFVLATSTHPFDLEIKRKKESHVRDAWKKLAHKEICQIFDLVLCANTGSEREFETQSTHWFDKTIASMNQVLLSQKMAIKQYAKEVKDAKDGKESKEVDKATVADANGSYVTVAATDKLLSWMTLLRDLMLFVQKQLPTLDADEASAVWTTFGSIKKEVLNIHKFVGDIGEDKMNGYIGFVTDMQDKMEAGDAGGPESAFQAVLKEIMLNPATREKLGALRPTKKDVEAAMFWLKSHSPAALSQTAPTATATATTHAPIVPMAPYAFPSGGASQGLPPMPLAFQQMFPTTIAPVSKPAVFTPAPAKAMTTPTPTPVAPEIKTPKHKPSKTPKSPAETKPSEMDELRKSMAEMKAMMESLRKENLELKQTKAATASAAPTLVPSMTAVSTPVSTPASMPTMPPMPNLSALMSMLPPGMDFGAIASMASQMDPAFVQAAMGQLAASAPPITSSSVSSVGSVSTGAAPGSAPLNFGQFMGAFEPPAPAVDETEEEEKDVPDFGGFDFTGFTAALQSSMAPANPTDTVTSQTSGTSTSTSTPTATVPTPGPFVFQM